MASKGESQNEHSLRLFRGLRRANKMVKSVESENKLRKIIHINGIFIILNLLVTLKVLATTFFRQTLNYGSVSKIRGSEQARFSSYEKLHELEFFALLSH
jgi:hypothetical protein